MSTAGASILAVGYLLPLVYLTLSLWLGAIAGAEPVGRHGPGVADALAAADPQLRRDPRRDRSGPTTTRWASRDQGARPWLRPRMSTPWPTTTAPGAPLRGPRPAAPSRDAGDVDLPGHRGHVLRRPVRAASSSTGSPTRRRSPRPAAQLNVGLGTINTVVLLTSSLTMALAVHAGETGDRKQAGPLPAPDDAPGHCCSSGSRRTSTTRSTRSTWSPAPSSHRSHPLPTEPRPLGGRARGGVGRDDATASELSVTPAQFVRADAAVLRLLLLHDRPARCST